jgi:Cu-Zn family superoxide dismutase
MQSEFMQYYNRDTLSRQNHSLFDFERQIAEKKKYISAINLEQAAEIKQFVLDVINKIRNNKNIQDAFTSTDMFKTWSELFTGKNINSTVNIVDSSLFESGCKHRIDLEIEGIHYRVLLLSCDGSLKIQNIVPQLKNGQIKGNSKKLFIAMYTVDNMLLGNLEIKLKDDRLVLSGNLDQLKSYANQKVGIHIHTTGNLTNQCKNCGSHFNPLGHFHGGTSGERHLGDFGNISVDQNGIANINSLIEIPKGWNGLELMNSFVGRSMVLHDKEDDLGKGINNESAITGNSGARIACGVIGGEF